MDKIELKPLVINMQESIGLFYNDNPVITSKVRKLPAVQWSQSNRCWFVPLDPNTYEQLYHALKDDAELVITELKSYLQKRKMIEATYPASSNTIDSKTVIRSAAWKLSKVNLLALDKFVEELKLKSYSLSTIRTYRSEFFQLLKLLKNYSVNDLTPNDLRRYMVYAMEKDEINENTAHSRLNAFYPVGFKKKDHVLLCICPIE